MKAGIADYPPLLFRTVSMWLGLPVLWAVIRLQRVPLVISRTDWPEVAKLAVTNMIVWHLVAILSLQALSSGRAAILGYTMPIFSALWGYALFGERLRSRHLGGVAAAAAGVALLLWHEFATLAGQPWAALGMLAAACMWGLGTQQMRRTTVAAPTLAIVFWMTLASTLVMSIASTAFESTAWKLPGTTAWFAIAFNAVLIFGFAQAIWLVMARNLPPVASSMSVMLIPVLGTLSGAAWLGEQLYWQDGAAIVLVLIAIGSVMLPERAPKTIES